MFWVRSDPFPLPILANLTEHYFELSKPDAKRALDIYRTFVKQTDLVVQYLSVARLHEHSTRLEIPKIKHAPTSLTQALEEYLNDKDFEVNRRQYLAEREAKKTGGKTTNGASKQLAESKPAASATSPTQSSAPSKPPAVSLPLIDFFDSIQDNQQTMGQPQAQQFPPQTAFEQPNLQMPQQTAGFQQQQQQQQQAFGPQDGQSTNPFAQLQQGMQQMNLQPMQQPQQPEQPQLQTQFTGAGFGGYTPQPFSPQNSLAPQNGMPSFSQQQPMMAEPLQAQPTSTNPFRASMLPPAQPTGMVEPKLLGNPTGAVSPLGRSPTNPFAKHSTGGFQSSLSPTFEGSASSTFSVPSIQSPQASSPFAPQPLQQQPLQPTPTGTNPFARNISPVQGPQSPPGGLTVHATGSTNPFRVSWHSANMIVRSVLTTSSNLPS